MYYINENIKNLNRIFDQNKREMYLRLDLNENPTGLSQEFIDEVLEGIDSQFISQYPETLEFTEALGDYLGTDIEHLCLVNGSSEGIRYIIQAFSSASGKIVGVTPTYAMFEIYSQMYGKRFVPVKYEDDLSLPVENVLRELSDDVDLLILVQPNNPVGNKYSREEFEQILEKCREHEITVLVDEAYHYFCADSFIDYALTQEHIFVTRTFSKLFSLAGCRLGYVAGWPEGVAMVQKLCTPHNVNAFALRFAKAVFQKEGLVDELVEKHREGRQYLIDYLEDNDYKFKAEEGNFMFIKPKTDPYELVSRMKSDKGILIKTYAGVGALGDCLRVTTGERKAMEPFVEALKDLDK